MKILAYPAFKTKKANPYTYLLYSNMPREAAIEELSLKRMLLSKYNIIHLHWASETITRHNNYFVAASRSLVFLFGLGCQKIKGAKIVKTIHDKTPHSIVHPKLFSFVDTIIDKICDSFINLRQILHGHYRSYYSYQYKKPLKQANNILFFGYISPYKNIQKFIEIAKQFPDKHFTIAGKPETQETRKEILDLTQNLPNVTCILRYIEESEIPDLFDSHELCILPFKEILNSGSSILSLSFNTPIIVPDSEIFRLWQSKFGKEWVRILSDDNVKQLINYPIPQTELSLKFLDWDRISHQTYTHYEDISSKT